MANTHIIESPYDGLVKISDFIDRSVDAFSGMVTFYKNYIMIDSNGSMAIKMRLASTNNDLEIVRVLAGWKITWYERIPDLVAIKKEQIISLYSGQYLSIKFESGKPLIDDELRDELNTDVLLIQHLKNKSHKIAELKGKYPRSSRWFISVGELEAWLSLSNQAKEHLEFLISDGINTDRLLGYVRSDFIGLEPKIAFYYDLRKEPKPTQNLSGYISTFETTDPKGNTKSE